MYFKRLEIFGFKSFADKTTLNFEPGITAVIGPNGCGKSNIFDAVRWVLGEQSVKELRGASMEDVIFNGTDKKPALGFAEVSLTFSNESKMLPVDYNEVTVTRRLFRSGESEYLLNKSPVRLKDICELFMGTGIGAEAYSLVQQGKVDLVVSAKPEDRRSILDEASGITKYKAKKREALNKLKDTEYNLLRINDIIAEVKRQISSCERQAKKARRYKDEFEKLKDFEVKQANHQLGDSATERRQLKARVEELTSQEQNLNAELARLNEQLTQENSLLEECEDHIAEVNAQNIKLDGQIDIDNRQIGFNEERIENIARNEARMNENRQQLTQRIQQHTEKLDEVQKTLASLKEALETNRTTLQQKKEQTSEIQHAIQQAQASIKDDECKILDITSSQVQIKNRLTETMKQVQGYLARKRRLETEQLKVTGEKEDIDQRLQNILQNIQDSEQQRGQLNAELEVQNKAYSELMDQLATLEEALDDLEKRKFFLKSQKEFIEKLAVQYQGIPDPMVEGRLITGTPPAAHHSGIIGKVKTVRALDAPQASIFRGGWAKDATPLYEVVCEAKFIELDPQQISAQIDELSGQIEEKILEKNAIIARGEDQKQRVAQVQKDLQELEKTHSIYMAQQNDIIGEVNKLKDELDLVKIELDEVGGSLVGAKQKEEDLTSQLDSLTQSMGSSQHHIRELQELITEKAKEREETTVTIAQLETEMASAQNIEEGHLENLKMLTEARNNDVVEIERMDAERAESQTKKEEYQKDIEDLQTKIVALKAEKNSLQDVVVEYEKQKEDLSQRMATTREQIDAGHGELETFKNRLHEEQMHEQEVTFKEKEIKDRLLQSYKIDLDAYNAQVSEAPAEPAQPEAAVPAMGPAELEEAIVKLRKRCDSFGSVNLVAIEEFDELRERFEFLTKQQCDLITAKESLHQTIRKINRQTRQMFMDTFTKVSEEFRIYFRMLFGGGEAQLVLLDPENVLESGIEIIARPPGKKLQNISLLSGGEKSLTAIALIFGVFKVNPSPFCVLDEIDAALDESNVGRFSYLLKDFAQIAQFIVITHNNKTIASANVLYGITMQETGVSKIVSVKFGENDKEKEPTDEVAAGV